MENLRLIEIRIPIPHIDFGTKGYFHGWCLQPCFDYGIVFPISKTMAIIEFLDGQVQLLDPEVIKFAEPLRK